MLSQALHTRQYTSICRLHIHRHFNHTLTSTSEEDTRIPVKSRKDNGPIRTAFIKTSGTYRCMADTWSLLRAVERKYGKVIEAHFLKDFEVKNKYQMRTVILFQDRESLRRIPGSGETFHFRSIDIKDRPGGFGLDAIDIHVMEGTDRDESFEFPSAASLSVNVKNSNKWLLGARISLPHKDYYTLPDKFSVLPDMAMAKSFLMWGGFHELSPTGASRKFKGDEWLEHSEPQTRMRVALQLCSQVSGFSKQSIDKNDGEVSDSSPGSASMDSPESSSTTLTAHKNDGKVSDSSSGPASTDLPESSSPTTLDIPISHESTSKSTQSRSLLTEFPRRRPPSQSPPELTQLFSEPIPPPEPNIPSPGQKLSPEQLQEQMSKAMQRMVKKRRAAREARKPEEEPEERLEDRKPHVPKFPAKRLHSQSKIAELWGRLER